MQWKTKSKIQRLVAALPVARERVYSLLQQTAGRQKQAADPRENFIEFAKVVGRIHEVGARIEGARIMEVGTGWGLDMPIAMYLSGSAMVQTFDLYPYLRPEKVAETLTTIRNNREAVRQIFAPFVDAFSLDLRLGMICDARTVEELMETANIEYFAPADATNTGLPAESIDIQFSYTVFEHIREAVVEGILREAGRVLRKTGFCFHHIDPSDHFAHDDRSISAVNFLQFSDKQWDHHASNQFAYHNRLRAADFERVFASAGHLMLKFSTFCDQRSLATLRAGLPLDKQYRGMDFEALCQTTVIAVSVPAGNVGPLLAGSAGNVRTVNLAKA